MHFKSCLGNSWSPRYEHSVYATRGTAALVAFVSKATPDKALAALAPLGGEVLRTSLSEEAEQEIQHALDARGTADADEAQA